MIVLFTDFGLEGPYTGQMKAAIHRADPGVPIIDLFADAPRFDPVSSAYLLAAYATEFEPGSVFVCVVDPGVGTDRGAVALHADGRWFVGPDNGLLAIVARRAASAEWYPIVWRPEHLSASFHGRDIFAPVAARLATGDHGSLGPPAFPAETGQGWPDDLSQVVYIDRYGNGMTGLRAAVIPTSRRFRVGGRTIAYSRTFGEAPPRVPFWYANANGLVEVAVNQGRADLLLGIETGMKVYEDQGCNPAL